MRLEVAPLRCGEAFFGGGDRFARFCLLWHYFRGFARYFTLSPDDIASVLALELSVGQHIVPVIEPAEGFSFVFNGQPSQVVRRWDPQYLELFRTVVGVEPEFFDGREDFEYRTWYESSPVAVYVDGSERRHVALSSEVLGSAWWSDVGVDGERAGWPLEPSYTIADLQEARWVMLAPDCAVEEVVGVAGPCVSIRSGAGNLVCGGEEFRSFFARIRDAPLAVDALSVDDLGPYFWAVSRGVARLLSADGDSLLLFSGWARYAFSRSFLAGNEPVSFEVVGCGADPWVARIGSFLAEGLETDARDVLGGYGCRLGRFLVLGPAADWEPVRKFAEEAHDAGIAWAVLRISPVGITSFAASAGADGCPFCFVGPLRRGNLIQGPVRGGGGRWSSGDDSVLWSGLGQGTDWSSFAQAFDEHVLLAVRAMLGFVGGAQVAFSGCPRFESPQPEMLFYTPDCPVCGDLASGRAVALSSERFDPFAHTTDQVPDLAFDLIASRLSAPLLGVARGFVPVVYGASFDEAHTVLAQGRRVRGVSGRGRPLLSDALASGKGTSSLQAMRSALGELVERTSVEFRSGVDIVRQASFEELREEGECICPPSELARFSPLEFANRSEFDGKAYYQYLVPYPWSEDHMREPLWWTYSRGLLAGTPGMWVPASHVWFNSPLDRPAEERLFDRRYCLADTNGLAAGSTLARALCHASAERIERDALALWWYSGALRERLDITPCPPTWCHGAMQGYVRCDRDLWFLDISTVEPLRVVVAVSCRREPWPGGNYDVTLGAGCAPTLAQACVRALTENIQLMSRDPTRPRVPGYGGPDAADWVKLDPYAASWLRGVCLGSDPIVVESDAVFEDIDDTTFVRLVEVSFTALGVSPHVVDLTRPDLGLPVVRVVCPDLCHFAPHYGDRRLTEEPARRGWDCLFNGTGGLNPLFMIM